MPQDDEFDMDDLGAADALGTLTDTGLPSGGDESVVVATGVAMATLPVTGEPRVDDALARLADLGTLPVDEHVGVFEDVQRRLHDTLADLSSQ